MRSLTVQVQVSADGYMAGPAGEMDWLTTTWSDDLSQYVAALTEPVDTILLGRVLAEGFIPAWASRPDEPGAQTFNSARRVVMSRSTQTAPWDNAEMAADLAATVDALRYSDGGAVIAYGGVQLVQDLIDQRLVDDLMVFVNPTAIGAGRPLFPEKRIPLQVMAVHRFDCGITAMHYRLAD